MDRLALLGGQKAVRIDRARASLPLVSERAIAAAVDLMRKGEISVSPIVDAFEREFADYVGTEYALAVTSGTSALHTALFAAGVAPGDEVLVPSYTFIATASVIAAAGGVAVFCDVDAETYCIDPEDILRKITPRTRAIMVVHVWGNPADMERILAIARRHDLAVIEDSSHAHGATWHGRKVGAVGTAAGFSLQGSKLVAAGEGGVFTTNVREVYERAILLARAEKRAEIPPDSPNHRYAFTGLGYKYRPHPLGIAIAREQLRELEERNAVRDRNGAALDAALADIPAIRPQKVLPGCRRVYAYHCARYDPPLLGGVSTETFLRALHAEGVSVGRMGYGRLHGQPLFVEGVPHHPSDSAPEPRARTSPAFANEALPVTERLREGTFQVAPRFETECRDLIDQYIEAYHKVASAVDELRAYEEMHAGKRVAAAVGGSSVNLL